MSGVSYFSVNEVLFFKHCFTGEEEITYGKVQ